MKLTPLDLRKQQFKKALRGYDPDEVRGFIEKLAQDWEEVLEEKRRAVERVEQYEDKLRHYEKVELALQEALEAARETGRRAEDAAHQRARLIVEEAELRAQRIVQDAEQERYNVRQDLVKLTSRQSEVAARLRAFLMSEMEVLAQFQGDDPIGFIKLVAATEGSAKAALPEARARLAPAPTEVEEAEEVPPAAPTPPPASSFAASEEPLEPPTEATAQQGAAAEQEGSAPSEAPEPSASERPSSPPPAPDIAEAPPEEPESSPITAVEPPPPPAAPTPEPDLSATPPSEEPSDEEVAPEEAVQAEPEPARGAPPWVDEGPGRPVPTYRDWLSVLSARREEAQASAAQAEPEPEVQPRGPEEPKSATSNNRFFRPPAPEPPPEPAPTSDAARGWSLRSIVTGKREERSESVVASEDERERIRRILEDLD